MKKKPSLKDIAREVGVSVPLVSYVLGGKGKENRVSDKTAKKIRDTAKALNYRPNLNARSLKTNRTKTIGVILADISNPFFANLARIIEDEAFSLGYTVIFGSSDENIRKFDRVLELLLTRQVDGLIIAPPEGSKKTISQLKKQNIPFVLIDRYFRDLDYNFIVADNFNASMMATRYLIKKGHKRIATIGYDSELAHYQDRYDGYFEILKRNGIEVDDSLVKRVKNGKLKSDMQEAINKLLNDHNATAIYFQTNTLAEEGLRQLIEIDRSILEKIDVVVFDQNSTYHFLNNFVPYVDQPIKEMGNSALRILITHIDNSDLKTSQLKLQTHLEEERIRKSL